VRVERHESERGRWEVVRRAPHPSLQAYLTRTYEGWTSEARADGTMREVPIPGIPLILNLGEPWRIADAGSRGHALRRDSFVAGMGVGPALVRAPSRSCCIELRLTPVTAHRILGVRMDELANRTVDVEDVLGRRGAELTARLRDASDWASRFDLIDDFLVRTLADARQPSPGVVWAWRRLAETGGRIPIRTLSSDLGWSSRRLIARFREQVGLSPKTSARVIRFDRAVVRLRDGDASLAAVAYECGYFDQAHFNRDFRELAGTTPTEFVAALGPSGSIAA
jgi:AraC-like DNA-binding protein